jgi:hypothetical protein
MKKTTARLFNNDTCWNIFDHTATPERFWDLQRQGKHSKARRAAIRLTLRHPLRMLPVITGTIRRKQQ